MAIEPFHGEQGAFFLACSLMLVNTLFRLWEEALALHAYKEPVETSLLDWGRDKKVELLLVLPSLWLTGFIFLLPYFRRTRSPGSTSTGDGDSFLKNSIFESTYVNKNFENIESIPIRKEDFIIPGFPNLTTSTETWLYQAENRELAFGTAFDLRLAATRCVPLNLALFWGTGIERRLSE